MSSPSDYNNGDFQDRVDVGGYKLHVQFAGLTRKVNTPLIICIHGTAGHLEQSAALVRTLAEKHRVLSYTRAGLGHSESRFKENETAEPPTLDAIAAELKLLLSATKQSPPFVLIGHSWGGMISVNMVSSLLHQNIPDIQGIVILDGGMPSFTSPPGQYGSFANDPGTPWAHSSVQAMLKGLDTFALQDPRNKLELNDTEYDKLIEARSTPQHYKGTSLEFQGLFGSYLPFAECQYEQRKTLPPMPICLVHAHAHESFRTMFEAGLAKGNGTQEEREDVERLLGTWKENVMKNQRQFLDLTGPQLGHSILSAKGTAHGVMMQDVASVVQGLEWVLQH